MVLLDDRPSQKHKRPSAHGVIGELIGLYYVIIVIMPKDVRFLIFLLQREAEFSNVIQLLLLKHHEKQERTQPTSQHASTLSQCLIV